MASPVVGIPVWAEHQVSGLGHLTRCKVWAGPGRGAFPLEVLNVMHLDILKRVLLRRVTDVRACA